MSTYYNFYAAKMDDKDHVSVLGPFRKGDDEEFSLMPILTRTRSFLEFDDFAEMGTVLSEDAAKSDPYLKSANYYPGMYYFIPYDSIVSMSSDGLVRGYVTIEQLAIAVACNYDPDYDWAYPMLPPEAVAEMGPKERGKYGHIAYIDVNKTEYICHQLITSASVWDYEMYDDRKSFGFILETM